MASKTIFEPWLEFQTAPDLVSAVMILDDPILWDDQSRSLVVFGLSGLVLVGSINGGQASNLCTLIAGGDVALSVAGRWLELVG